MMYCVYSSAAVQCMYVRTQSTSTWIVFLCAQSRDCECSVILCVPYNSVVRTLFADVIFTSLLDILSEEMSS